ncbi:MAG: 1-deoxy-D-xylulose-5-phosphate reductoisomerase [Candidatus Eisenbacteria bacterium]|nr:1-deoxy-D-xylulose-5-phosphate reductoisomerase [Candidatus Eisenbacteria bacterium]
MRIALLGSTGSIGRSVLDVVRRHRDRFEVVAMTANRNTELLGRQAAGFGCRLVAVSHDADAGGLPDGLDVRRGPGALEELAALPEADLVVNALVGGAGLRPAAASVAAGKRLALANKESLVTAGGILTADARRSGAEILPVDSEHSSLRRCLAGRAPEEIDSVVLTASGGALRDRTPAELESVRVEEVLRHPTWDMGPKVTVDSATLVNKAFEVIEAHWLFGVPLERVGVVLHAQSIAHCFVRLTDGSLLAHLSEPDMRVPIQDAMFAPGAPPVELSGTRAWELGTLSFEPVDTGRYPCFGLVLEAARAGGTAPAVAAAADEVAVSAFVAGRIPFNHIRQVIEATLDEVPFAEADTLDAVFEADAEARKTAHEAVERTATRHSDRKGTRR